MNEKGLLLLLRGAKAKTGIKLGKEWLVIEMSPKAYAKLIGHSEAYVRKYCMKDSDAPKVQIRVRTEDILEDIWDVRGIGNESQRGRGC